MPRATGTLVIKVHHDAARYHRVAAKLRAAGHGDLQRKLTAAIRKDGGPALAAVRAAWLGIEVGSTRGGVAPPDTSTGLRRRAAAATQMSARPTGIRISADGNAVVPGYPSVLLHLNGQGRWTHPVFGHRRAQTTETGTEVFAPTLMRFAPKWESGLLRVMEETVRDIAT